MELDRLGGGGGGYPSSSSRGGGVFSGSRDYLDEDDEDIEVL